MFKKSLLLVQIISKYQSLPTTKLVEIINKKKFVKTVLDENFEAFIIYMTFLNLNLISICLVRKI